MVEVTAMNHQGKTISVPIANLHVSCLPMVSIYALVFVFDNFPVLKRAWCDFDAFPSSFR